MGGDVEKTPRGTKAGLNLCEKEDAYHCEFYRWEPITDAAPAPSLEWLRQMVEFVANNRKAGRTTFVHCRNGVSRSGLVMTAYLMRKNHWPRDEALAFIRTKRPEARPNPAFMKLLLDWQRELGIGSQQFNLVPKLPFGNALSRNSVSRNRVSQRPVPKHEFGNERDNPLVEKIGPLTETESLLLMAAAVQGLGPRTNLIYANSARVVHQVLKWRGLSEDQLWSGWGERDCDPQHEQVFRALVRMVQMKLRGGSWRPAERPGVALFEGGGNWGVPGDSSHPPSWPLFNSCRQTAEGKKLARKLLKEHPEYRKSYEHRKS